MFLKLLDEEDIAYLRNQLTNKKFVDGKKTQAISKFYDIKQNKETIVPERVRKYLIDLLYNNSYIDSVYCPNRVSVNFYNRYTEGDFYDYHIDSFKASPKSNNVFYDYGFSINLNDDYEGGEFIIKTEAGEVGTQLQAGQAAVFPIIFPHKVGKVTKGVRENIIGWFSSNVSYEQFFILKHLQESAMTLTKLMKEDDATAEVYNELLLNNTLVQNYLKKLWGK
jgi:PKHD-type hydroxylase